LRAASTGLGRSIERDTRLDRDVALKVLPAFFTTDPDRVAQLEQEARHGYKTVLNVDVLE
jgi:hypothetical protein